MSIFSKRLKELRCEAKISQQELSKIIGISKSSINMYERGEREPGLEMVKAFADFFDVGTDYLLGKSNDRRSITNGKKYSRLIIDMLESYRKSHGLTRRNMEEYLDWENMYGEIESGRTLVSEDYLFIIENMLKVLDIPLSDTKTLGNHTNIPDKPIWGEDPTDELYKKISMLDDEDKGKVDGFVSGLLATNKYRGEEQTYQIKIAARGGGVKEITLTESQMAAILNAPEVTDLGPDKS